MKGFTQRLSCDTRIVTGLAAMYLWTWLIYWGGPFSLRGYTIELTNARWGVNVIMGALAVGVVLLLACRARTNQARLMTAVRLAAMLCGFAGTGTGLLLVAHFPLPAEFIEPVALVSGLFTGLTEGLLLCQWCSQTAALGVRTALFHNAIALLFGGVAFLVCNVVPSVFALVVGFVCPGVGFWAGQRAATHPMGLPYEDEERPADPTAAAAAPKAAPGGQAANIPAVDSASAVLPETPRSPLGVLLHDRAFLMLAGLAFVFGLSNGFINAGFEVVPQELYRISCFGVVLGTIFASGLTFLAAFALKLDAWQLVLCVSLPLMAMAYVLFPYEAFWYMGWGVHALGYQFFFMTLWSLLGSRQLRHDVAVTVSVPTGLLAIQVGSVVGLIVWDVFCIGIDSAGEHLVSGIALMLLVLVAVLFERPQFGWGDVHPGVATPMNALEVDDYRQVIQRIRDDYALSPREFDVCMLLGRGRNRQFVASELSISLETAKTHTTNVYRKLGVHSQQELLDVIEMVRNTLGAERKNGPKTSSKVVL